MPVRAGLASAVALADWNRDGKIDLIVGNIDGEVSFLPNQSKDRELFFGPGQPVVAGGQKIDVKSDAGPLVADWNGDGIPDLLLGATDGSVTFYAGSGKTGAPVLSRGKTLVDKLPEELCQPVVRERDPKTGEWTTPDLERPSMRTKLAVYDWNGDGKLDLIVGDVVAMTSSLPVLDDAKKKERDDLQAQKKLVDGEMSGLFSAIREPIRKDLRAQNPEMDETTLGILATEKAYEAVAKDDRYCELTNKSEAIVEKLRPLTADRSTHGFVWVYLRTANAN